MTEVTILISGKEQVKVLVQTANPLQRLLEEVMKVEVENGD